MDPRPPPPPSGETSCPLCYSPLPWLRSVKRKFGDGDDVEGGASGDGEFAVARVDAADETAALREAAAAAASLAAELEEERSAAASAASEAMAMIVRLQREKAEAQMEARQFRRFADERMALDADIANQREDEMRILSYKVEFYRRRLEQLGIPAVDDERYPRLTCNGSFDYGDWEKGVGTDDDVECYEYEDHPNTGYDDLERRIVMLEQSPRMAEVDDDDENFAGSVKNDHFDDEVENGDDGDEKDDENARVYTIDSVDGVGKSPWPMPALKEKEDSGERNLDVKKLHARLEALEVERDSMRHALAEMVTEKAQLLLLKEIAQQLAKERPTQTASRQQLASPTPFSHQLSTVNATKCGRDYDLPIVAKLKVFFSMTFSNRRGMRPRHTFGISKSNVGLLQLLERSAHVTRSLTVTQG